MTARPRPKPPKPKKIPRPSPKHPKPIKSGPRKPTPIGKPKPPKKLPPKPPIKIKDIKKKKPRPQAPPPTRPDKIIKKQPKIYQMESGQATAQMGIGPFKTIWSFIGQGIKIGKDKVPAESLKEVPFGGMMKKRGWTQATHPTLAEQTRPVVPEKIHTKMVGGKIVLDSKAAGDWFGGYIRHAQAKGFTRGGGGMKGLPTFDRNMGFPGPAGDFNPAWGQNIVQKARLEQGQVLGKTLKKDIKLTAQGKKLVQSTTPRRFTAKDHFTKKITSSDLNRIWNGLPSAKQLQIMNNPNFGLVKRYGFESMSFEVKQAILKQAGLVK